MSARLPIVIHRSTRTTGAGLEALGLWALCLSWSAQEGTDGAIPRATALAFGEPVGAELAARLVEAGLFEVADGGWKISGYLDANASAEQEAKAKAKEAERSRRRRAKAKASVPPTSSPPISAPRRPDVEMLGGSVGFDRADLLRKAEDLWRAEPSAGVWRSLVGRLKSGLSLTDRQRAAVEDGWVALQAAPKAPSALQQPAEGPGWQAAEER